MKKIDQNCENTQTSADLWEKYLDTYTKAKKPRSIEKPSAGNAVHNFK